MKLLLKNLLFKIGLLGFAANIKQKIIFLYALKKWSDLQKNPIVCLELGSGPKKGVNGWVTVDFAGADISYDLRKGIPLPAESVDRIYTSHMLEHIPYKELLLFLNDCYRVLKKNGELSVSVPDASRFIRAYIDKVEFLQKNAYYEPATVDTDSLMDQINYIAYMDGQHKYLFDSQNLVNTLKKVPFSKVRLRDYDESLDLKARDHESIYAIAIK